MTVTQHGTGKGVNVVTTGQGCPQCGDRSSCHPPHGAVHFRKCSACRTGDRQSGCSRPGAIAAAGNAAALQVQGVAAFTRSGTAVISATFTSVAVSVPGGLTAAATVLATMQTHLASGTPRVLAAVPNPANGKITVYRTRLCPRRRPVTVAWFVFG